jgi:hypothetical protein
MQKETKKQLTAHKIKMNISFVLLAEQQNVYDAFVQCLNDMQAIDLSVSSKSSTKKRDDQSSIAYDSKGNEKKKRIFLFQLNLFYSY